MTTQSSKDTFTLWGVLIWFSIGAVAGSVSTARRYTLNHSTASSTAVEGSIVENAQTQALSTQPPSVTFTAADKHDSYQELQDRVDNLQSCIDYPDECYELNENELSQYEPNEYE
jgi:hypothetical protein